MAGALRQWRRCGRDADIDPWEHLIDTAVAFVIDEMTTEPENLQAGRDRVSRLAESGCHER